MAIRNDKIKNLLLENFDTLKNDIENNSEHLVAIVEKMFSIDNDLSIEMWKYLLNNNFDYHEYSHRTNQIIGFMDFFLKNAGGKAVLKFLENNTKIRNILFHETYCVDYDFIIWLINENDLYNLNEYLQDIYTNPYLGEGDVNGFGKYLVLLTSPYSIGQINAETVELLLEWAEKVQDNSSRAKISVNLMDFM